jgi:hypothetical protein
LPHDFAQVLLSIAMVVSLFFLEKENNPIAIREMKSSLVGIKKV